FNMDVEINTDSDGRCNIVSQPAPSPSICLLAANAITVNAKITAKGSRALTTLTVNAVGVIDVSSHGAGLFDHIGPAANAGIDFGCTATAGEQQQGNYGAGGGAAGSFGGTGGAGGLAD